LMAEMAGASGMQGPAGRAADLEPEVELARALIRAAADVGAVRGLVRTASAEWPVGRIEGAYLLARWAGEIVNSLDTDGAIRTNRVIDDALELVDAIAIAWDQDLERRWLSQAAAQVSQLLLNAFASDHLVDERRELAMSARHARLSWLAPPSQRRTFSAEVVAPYAINRLRTLLNLFARTMPARTSEEPVGIQWSLAWRGLALTSELLESYPEGSAQSDVVSQSVVVEFAFLYREFLRRYVLALLMAGRASTNGFAQISEEFQVVDDIFQGVRSHAEVVQLRWAAIEQLRTRLRSRRRISFVFDRRLGSLIGND
jgi:hypothetical protein